LRYPEHINFYWVAWYQQSISDFQSRWWLNSWSIIGILILRNTFTWKRIKVKLKDADKDFIFDVVNRFNKFIKVTN
jgi:hypothetical protein